MTMAATGLNTGDTRSRALVHARIMLRRNLRHMQRYPSLTLMIMLMPLVFLLLFVYIFGGTLGSGLGGGMPAGVHGGRAAYADYVAPAIILMAVAAAAQGTAIAVAQDMTEGIIGRFRTMAVARSSVLTGHFVGATIQTLIGVAVVTAAALAVGFRPHANVAEWLAAFGVVLLLFVYVFGGTLGSGLGARMPAGLHGGRSAYANYVAPAIILMAVAAAAQGTAIAVAQDMTEGVIARFRTMAVARSSVLTGHVVGATIQTLIGVVVVTAAAIGVGFRPHANAAEWLAAFGVVLLLTFAVTWLCVGLGLSAKSVETASNSPMFLILLPFLGSGFVPTSSLPAGVRWFAEYQPFTPVNETLRGLLTGTKIGDNLIITIAWCVGVAVLSYVWSRRLYEREPKPL